MARVAYVTGAEVDDKSPAFAGALVISGQELAAAVGRLLWPELSAAESLDRFYTGLPQGVPLGGFCHAIEWELTIRYGYELSQSQRVVGLGHIFAVSIWRDMLQSVAEACFCSVSETRVFHFEPATAADFNELWRTRLIRLDKQVYSDWDGLQTAVLSFLRLYGND